MHSKIVDLPSISCHFVGDEPSKKRRISLVIASLIVLLFVSTPVALTAAESHSLSERYRIQRQLFMEGREWIAAGNTEAAVERIADLNGYPLQYYYEYLLLRQRLKDSDKPLNLLPLISAFDDKYKDPRAHRRLLGALKNRLAADDDWQSYARVALLSAAPTHPCDDLFSKVTADGLQRFDESASVLWPEVSRHTERCERAFELLIKRAGDVPTAALWKRTATFLKRGSLDEIKPMLRFFGKRDRRIVQTWMDHIDDPRALLELEADKGNLKHHPSLIKHVFSRWLASDLPAATAYWNSNGSVFGFSQKEIEQSRARHAVLAAKRSLPEADSLLGAASDDSRAVRYWRVRLALRDGRWADVIDHLDQLTDTEQQSTRWRYWRARALEALGLSSDATAIYTEVAQRTTYYGFLSADRLAANYRIDASPPIVDQQALAALLDDNQMAEAVEFFLADIGWEGRRVWNAALSGASNAQLVAAAALALEIGWYDRSYSTIRRANVATVFDFQYPMPHQLLIKSLTEDRSVDESLVYAVMRRESAYIPDIRSPAGAIGLMQLMPATAKEVAGKIALPESNWRLIDGEVNIRLGTAYLDSMLNRHNGNVAYAAAAYNAGPSRVSRWTEEISLPMDIWVETIPFDETRDYVKGVLFNAAVFNVVRQKPQTRLLAMMGSS